MLRYGLGRRFNNFAPRVGASWDLTGRGTLILRGGYGIFYDSGTLIENSALYFTPPYWQLRLFFPSAQGPISIANPFSGAGRASAPTINTIARDFRTGYAQQASLGLERAFTALTLTARYVGAFGDGYVRKRNLNQPEPGTGDIASRRPIPGYGDIPSSSGSDVGLSRAAAGGRAEVLARLASGGYRVDAGTHLGVRTPTRRNSREKPDFAAEWGPPNSTCGIVWSLGEWKRAVREAPPRAADEVGAPAAQSGRTVTPRVRFDNRNRQHRRGTVAYEGPTGAGQHRRGAGLDGRASSSRRSSPRQRGEQPDRAGLCVADFRGEADGAGVVGRSARLEISNALSRQNLNLPDSFVDRPTFGQSLSALPSRQAQLAARLTF